MTKIRIGLKGSSLSVLSFAAWAQIWMLKVVTSVSSAFNKVCMIKARGKIALGDLVEGVKRGH
ncbi:hypothetical protein D9M71_605450 [compost metagenome]